MTDCPVLSTEDGKLIYSTEARSPGTVVVIGCSGFGRHKTEPTSVLCTGGAWSPAPTTDCETGFDDRETLFLAIGVSCAFFALVVLICLCCYCCCFFNDGDKYRYPWIRRYSGGRYIIDRGPPKFSSYPRDIRVSHREIYRPYHDDDSLRSYRSYERTKRYSRDFEKRRSHGKPVVYTRETFIPDYNFFEDKAPPGVSERGYSRTRRYSGEYNKPPMEYRVTRRYSDGSREDMMRRTGYSIKRSSAVPIEEPAVVQYIHTNVEPIVQQPIVRPIVEYVDKPINVQYVEKPQVEYVEQYIDKQPMEFIERQGSYTASFVPNGRIDPYIFGDDALLNYDRNGFSSLPRANITEVADESQMKIVPYKTPGSLRSSQVMDPTMYFLGRQDYTHDSWHS